MIVAALDEMRAAAFEQNHAQRVVSVADQLRRADGVKRNIGAVNDVDGAGALQGERSAKSGLIPRPEIEPDIAAADFLAVHRKAITLRQRIGVEIEPAGRTIVHCVLSLLRFPAFGSEQNNRYMPHGNSL